VEVRHNEGVATASASSGAPAPTNNARFAIGRKDEAKPAAFLRYVMKGPGIPGDRIETGVAPSRRHVPSL
jgi:hypothetical protein